jgi:hypothetical protein
LVWSRAPCGSRLIIYSGNYEMGQSPAWTWGGTASNAPYIYACPAGLGTDALMAAWSDGAVTVQPTSRESGVTCCTPAPVAPATLRIKRGLHDLCVDGSLYLATCSSPS